MSLLNQKKEKEENPLERIIRKRKYLAVIALILIFSFTFLFSKFSFHEKKAVASPINFTLTEAQVLSICKKELITQDFIARNPTYKTEVRFLDKATLQDLSKTYPAIYASLPKENGLYKVRYFGKKEGIMLIVDPKNKEVLKYYRVKTLTFP